MEQTLNSHPRRRARPAMLRLLRGARLLVRMARDPSYRFPPKTKMLVVLSLVYLVSPVDLIPDFLPVIGFVDDLALLTATAAVLAGHARDYAQRRNIEF